MTYESPSNNQMVAYFTTPPDSGSTHHITSDLANVTLGNGQGLKIYHRLTTECYCLIIK